jgi:hypothetical protein
MALLFIFLKWFSVIFANIRINLPGIEVVHYQSVQFGQRILYVENLFVDGQDSGLHVERKLCLVYDVRGR